MGANTAAYSSTHRRTHALAFSPAVAYVASHANFAAVPRAYLRAYKAPHARTDVEPHAAPYRHAFADFGAYYGRHCIR